ncbi:MAG: hypothetical protein ACI4NW_02450 [Stenotrophomonas sp.]
MNKRLLRNLLLGLALLPLLALAANPPRKAMRSFDQVHVAWANAMRWGEAEEREPFLAAPALAGLDDLQRRRWEQVRISGYRERSRNLREDGRLHVRAEVSVINVHTQAERSVVVDEYWAWLPELRSWKLDSGLPDLWPER